MEPVEEVELKVECSINGGGKTPSSPVLPLAVTPASLMIDSIVISDPTTRTLLMLVPVPAAVGVDAAAAAVAVAEAVEGGVGEDPSALDGDTRLSLHPSFTSQDLIHAAERPLYGCS